MSKAVFLLAAFAAFGVAAALSPAQAQDYGPNTCVSGYVWREAFPGDVVCVLPQVRTQTREDNQLANARRQPGGGAYGPNTCRSGFVWRDALPGDYVCVTPETRAQAAADNRAADSRRVRFNVPYPIYQ